MQITFEDLVHFVYVGGGYYRGNRVPKGEHSTMLHGGELLKLVKKHITEPNQKTV